MSNHLSFMIYHYALIFPKKNWPKNITIGGMLIKNGEKISKSKGNGIPLIRIKERYGVDLYRLYIALASNYESEMNFRDDDIFQLEKRFEKLKSYIKKSLKYEKKNINDFSKLQKWLISRFYYYIENYFQFMKELRIREAFVGIIYEFLNDISYLQRRTNLDETLSALRFILKDYLLVLTPAIPHFSEEINEKLLTTSNKKIEKKSAFISIQKFETNPKEFRNKKLEEIELIVSELITNITKQKEYKNIQQLKSITIIQAKNERFKLFDELKKLLKDNTEINNIFSTLNKKFPEENKFIKKFVPKTLGSGLSTYLKKEDEFKLLNSITEFLKKEFNCENIKIIKEDNNKNEISIIPTKPGIILE